MTPEQIYYNPKATKLQLRKALAETLGIEFTQTGNQKPVSVYTECVHVFMSNYKSFTNLDYNFESRDGKAVKEIITKIEHITKTGDIVQTFEYLVTHLPEWYKENAFSLVVINNKFNEIIAAIRNSKKTINDEYRQRIIDDLYK